MFYLWITLIVACFPQSCWVTVIFGYGNNEVMHMAGTRDNPGLAGRAGSRNSPAPWPCHTAPEGPDHPGPQGSLQRPIKGTLILLG